MANQVTICPHCRQPLGTGARFCKHCGKSIDASSSTAPPVRPSRKRQKYSPILIGLITSAAVFLIGSIFIAIYLLTLP